MGRRWAITCLTVLSGLVLGIAAGEWYGWPFLAAPLQQLLSARLDRHVRLGADAPGDPVPNRRFSMRLIGGVRLFLPQLEIASPAWSNAPYLLMAKDVVLQLRYADLWRAYAGQQLRVKVLHASTLDGYLERLTDGRASWQFRSSPGPAPPLPRFDSLQIAQGVVHYSDALLDTQVEAHLSLADGADPPAANRSGGPSRRMLQVDATGRYRKLPVLLKMSVSDSLQATTDAVAATTASHPLSLHLSVGRAVLAFDGQIGDAFNVGLLDGRFMVKGPSLAAVGDPLGVTLPTTGNFRTQGRVLKTGWRWNVAVDDALIGASHLNGHFVYQTGQPIPKLSAQLGGSRLLLSDLGPALGASPGGSKSGSRAHKVLPVRPFDLKSLRVMDADVLIDIDEVDLNTPLLESLRPLHGRLQLSKGVLMLTELDARTAKGQLAGDLRLDGRTSIALWDANLRWSQVALESWIHQSRGPNLPPFISGRLDGSATLKGEGRSTAEILGSLNGHVRTELKNGTVSHVAIELGGLDVAESLGVWAKGDDALPVTCAIADLYAKDGLFRPRLVVLDTRDSAVWIDGTLSLATERMDLRAVVSPKDFSPLTLRSPLHVRGTFADPQVSLDTGTMGRTLGTSALLAFVNPLAALIPLIDAGDHPEADGYAAGCKALVELRSRMVSARRPSLRSAPHGTSSPIVPRLR